ncbi:hypothetical protein HY604_00965 [Candidatus Peregrinibacteria bacterium]|nr:hypothetical protein [Candidatus Peregrinibacteria bacterium]
MDFESAQRYLEKFVSYEKAWDFKYNEKAFDLERVRIFLREFGVDFGRFKYFHVGGSKGKGSVCKMIHDYIFRSCCETRTAVGLFLSPHVVSVCERIVVDGEMILEGEFALLVEELRSFLESADASVRALKLTWFEIMFVLALKYFAEKKCEYVVLEVGMGGRLDVTNIVTPLVSVLTSLELEHVNVLGDNLSSIFAEKWGIKKSGVPIVLNEEMRFFAESASGFSTAEVFFARNNEEVAKLALIKAGFAIDENLWSFVVKNFKFIGRYDLREIEGKFVLFDIAHTVKSAERLVLRLSKEFPDKEKTFVLGVLKDKNIDGMRKIFEALGRVVFVGGFSERALSGENYREAFSREFEKLKKEQILVVTGSSYLVGKILGNF